MIVLNIFLAVMWVCLVIVPVAIEYNTSDIVTGIYNNDENDKTFHLTNLFDGRVCMKLCM